MAKSADSGFFCELFCTTPLALYVPSVRVREVDPERVEMLAQSIMSNGYLQSGSRIVVFRAADKKLVVVDGAHRALALKKVDLVPEHSHSVRTIQVDLLRRMGAGKKESVLSDMERISLGSHYNHIGDSRQTVTVVDDLHTLHSALQFLEDGEKSLSENRLSQLLVEKNILGGKKSAASMRNYIVVVRALSGPSSASWECYRTICRGSGTGRIPIEYLVQGTFRALESDEIKALVLRLTASRVKAAWKSRLQKSVDEDAEALDVVTVPAVSFRTQKGALLESMIVLARTIQASAFSHGQELRTFLECALCAVSEEDYAAKKDSQKTVWMYCEALCMTWDTWFPVKSLENFCRRLHRGAVPVELMNKLRSFEREPLCDEENVTADIENFPITQGVPRIAGTNSQYRKVVLLGQQSASFNAAAAAAAADDDDDDDDDQDEGGEEDRFRGELNGRGPAAAALPTLPKVMGEDESRDVEGADAKQKPKQKTNVRSPPSRLCRPPRTPPRTLQAIGVCSTDESDVDEGSCIEQVVRKECTMPRARNGKERSLSCENRTEQQVKRRKVVEGVQNYREEEEEEEEEEGLQSESHLNAVDEAVEDPSPSRKSGMLFADIESRMQVHLGSSLVSELGREVSARYGAIPFRSVGRSQLFDMGFTTLHGVFKGNHGREAMDDLLGYLVDNMMTVECNEEETWVAVTDHAGKKGKRGKDRGLRKITSRRYVCDYLEEQAVEFFQAKCTVEMMLLTAMAIVVSTPENLACVEDGCRVVASAEGCKLQEPRTTFRMDSEDKFEPAKSASYVVLGTGRDPVSVFVWPLSHWYLNAGPPYPDLHEKKVEVPAYSMYIARADMAWAYAGVSEENNSVGSGSAGGLCALHAEMLLKHNTHLCDEHLHIPSVFRYVRNAEGRRLYGRKK